MRSAVLFLVFNRPELTRQAFERLRAARPPRLYVAADGPRDTRPHEFALCEQVRRIATAVDWPCDVKTLFRSTNLGCKHAVADAIGWFFEQEDEGIIIEDDILADSSFFEYCDELLDAYRDDHRVAMISGTNYFGEHGIAPASYAATNHLPIWGWASWRRAWRHYAVEMPGWPGEKARQALARAMHGDSEAASRWSRTFDAVAAGQIDTWDYQWAYAAWRAAMFAIVPRYNLVVNLGFGRDATHTTAATPFAERMKPQYMPFPLIPPRSLQPSARLDRRIDNAQLGRRVLPRLKRTIRRALHRVRSISSAALPGVRGNNDAG